METKPLITIRLELDLSPAVKALLNTITGRTAVEVTTEPEVKAESHETEEPKSEEVATEKAEEPQEEEAKAEEPKTKVPTKADVRTAMEAKMADLVKEDGSRNENLYKELKRTFKSISAELGADKPSELDEDRRAEFIERVEKLTVSPEQILPF